MRYIQDKKGLSDIVTTTLIILLVAVAVAAIWAFVGPALKGTGTQFSKSQTCIANQIDITACKAKFTGSLTSSPTTLGAYPLLTDVRRTLSDNVANLKSYKIEVIGGSNPSITSITELLGTDVGSAGSVIPLKAPLPAQGSKVKVEVGDSMKMSPSVAAILGYTAVYAYSTSSSTLNQEIINQALGSGVQARVVATYENPDKSIVVCQSLPLSCQTQV